jgi:hypothetical protein
LHEYPFPTSRHRGSAVRRCLHRSPTDLGSNRRHPPEIRARKRRGREYQAGRQLFRLRQWRLAKKNTIPDGRERSTARTEIEIVTRRQDREFFIGFARSWRSKSTEGAHRTQAATNDHAPEPYRISTVRNLDTWYDALDGQPLCLEPKERVRVW